MLAMATPPTSPTITAIARYPAQSCRIPARSRYQADRAADGITSLHGFASAEPGSSHQRPQLAVAIPVQSHAEPSPVAVPARPCLCRSRPAVVRPPPCRGYVPAPAADPLRHTVVISRIRHTSQDAATKLHDGASYTSRRSRLELARRNFRHNGPARPPTGIGWPGSPAHPQGRTRRHRQHTGQPAWNRSPGAHSRGGNDAPLTQREAMIGAGRPPTDEQISQICACQLVSTRLAQAAPNGGSGVSGRGDASSCAGKRLLCCSV